MTERTMEAELLAAGNELAYCLDAVLNGDENEPRFERALERWRNVATRAHDPHRGRRPRGPADVD
jgi:hypothetical protein